MTLTELATWLTPPKHSLHEAYRASHDYGLHGATEENSDFHPLRLSVSLLEHTQTWEEDRRDARAGPSPLPPHRLARKASPSVSAFCGQALLQGRGAPPTGMTLRRHPLPLTFPSSVHVTRSLSSVLHRTLLEAMPMPDADLYTVSRRTQPGDRSASGVPLAPGGLGTILHEGVLEESEVTPMIRRYVERGVPEGDLLVAVWQTEIDRYRPDADPADSSLAYVIDYSAEQWLRGAEAERAEG